MVRFIRRIVLIAPLLLLAGCSAPPVPDQDTLSKQVEELRKKADNLIQGAIEDPVQELVKLLEDFIQSAKASLEEAVGKEDWAAVSDAVAQLKEAWESVGKAIEAMQPLVGERVTQAAELVSQRLGNLEEQLKAEYPNTARVQEALKELMDALADLLNELLLPSPSNGA